MNLVGGLRKAVGKVRRTVRDLPYDLLKRRLKGMYKGESAAQMSLEHVAEPVNEEIVVLGRELREAVLRDYRERYRSKPYRILFQVPPSGLGVVWFEDLMQVLMFAGIKCASVQWGDPHFRETWEAFGPNVFISLDIANVLRSLDHEFINRYKRSRGCLRLFTPVNKSHFPNPGMSAEDRWRLDLALRGLSVDAYFCMFIQEYFTQFWHEWADAGFQYLSLPHGCNPIYQYPREGPRDLDYFMATSYGPERVELTYQYLGPIFKKHHGMWAGPGWGFGLGPVDRTQLPGLYARAKIVPNPLARFLIRYPSEITERAFSAAACGAFQITDWTPVTGKFYSPDELITVHGSEEFLDRFSYFVSRPEERDRIVKRALRRVFQEHTYFHRVDRLVEFLDTNKQLMYSPPELS